MRVHGSQNKYTEKKTQYRHKAQENAKVEVAWILSMKPEFSPTGGHCYLTVLTNVSSSLQFSLQCNFFDFGKFQWRELHCTLALGSRTHFFAVIDGICVFDLLCGFGFAGYGFWWSRFQCELFYNLLFSGNVWFWWSVGYG